MKLCDFCAHDRECYPKYCQLDDYCRFEGNEESVIKYAKENNMSVSDAVLLIKFCCGLK